jgi:hypothetical protein
MYISLVWTFMTSLPIGCLYFNWYYTPRFVLSIYNYMKWATLDRDSYGIYLLNLLDFHQLPLLRQAILLNYYHCCPNCSVCLSSRFLFAQKSFLPRILCFYFYFCKKVKRNIIVWSNNIATNCNLNLAVL